MAAGAGIYGQLGNGTWTHASGIPSPVRLISSMSYYDEERKTILPMRCRCVSAGTTHAAAVIRTYRPMDKEIQRSLGVRHGEDLYVWGCNKYYQLGLGGKHNNVAKPTTIIPFPLMDGNNANMTKSNEKIALLGKSFGSNIPSTIHADEETSASRMLTLSGPLLTNRQGTVAFTGGQLQLLTEQGRETEGPIHRVYCGPEITILH